MSSLDSADRAFKVETIVALPHDEAIRRLAIEVLKLKALVTELLDGLLKLSATASIPDKNRTSTCTRMDHTIQTNHPPHSKP